jgi:hypothetical protein
MKKNIPDSHASFGTASMTVQNSAGVDIEAMLV